MVIVTSQNQIAISVLKKMAEKMFGNFVKAAVDVEKGIMAVDGELHSDEELLLVEGGSRRPDVWGINLYPDFLRKKKFVEFDSMINIKPALGNRSRGVDDPEIKRNILEIVKKLVID